MKVDLGGQVAVFTGGAQGIGRAIVQDFAENGAHVVIVDADGEGAERAAQEVVAGGETCMALAGVANLTRSMALELGPHGILVNAVAPGSTLTRGTRALFYGSDGVYTEQGQSLVSHIPLGRPGTPEEIAHAVLFLAAPEASYINGTILVVDGGWTAGYTRDW